MLYVIMLLLIGLKLEMGTAYFVLLGIAAVVSCIKLGVDLAKAWAKALK